MANVQIYKYQFLQNNPYGTYVAGDVIDIYVDPDLAVVPTEYFGRTTGVSMYLNGVLQTSSTALILSFSPSLISIQEFNPQICISTTLLSFAKSTFFPFARYTSLENHYSCVVNAPTCDLMIVGVPTVVPATDTTADDGSISITATSTNAIKYKIGSDFAYDDGTGQTSGTFSGLLPGDYRIYLRDEANCAVNILVTVGVDNSYGAKFRLGYEDNNGWQTKIEITKRGYSGSVAEICGTATPFTLALRGEGGIDRFEPILASQGNLNLVSETDQAFLELYTNDPNLYRISYYKDTGGGYALKWVGKVLPMQYAEEYKAPPYFVSVVATDSLPELNEFYLIQDDGQKYEGKIKLIKLIAHCLSKLKMGLPIRVACNLYADTMNQTDADDPFDQAYCDFEAFYLKDDSKLWNVMREILKPFGARIVQWDGRWNIVRVEEMAAAYDYRDFDAAGDYVTNGTYDPVVDIDFPNNNGEILLANRDHSLEMRPGYGSIKVVYDLGLKPNILQNGDFRLKSFYYQPENRYFFEIDKSGWTLVNAGYTLQESFEFIDDDNVAYTITANSDILNNVNGGEAYLQSGTYFVRMGANNQLKINIRYRINKVVVLALTNYVSIDVPYVKLRVRVKYGSLYLNASGNWSSTENYLTFFVTEFDKFIESEILALQPGSGTPVNGMDLDVRIYHAYAYHAQFDSLTDLEAFDTFDGSNQVIATGYKTEVRDDFTTPSYIYYYELQENTSAASGYDIVRPDDYNAGTNPRQWILRDQKYIGGVSGTNVFPLTIDHVIMTYLTDKKAPFDTIVRYATGESNNKDQLDLRLILGSSGDLINTETRFGIELGAFFPNAKPGLTITSQNILSYDLIYAGYLRDESGEGYELWARDGVSESDKLHGIYLKMYAKQYQRSWRLFRGSYYTASYFGLLDVMRETNDNGRIYLPIGITLDDKMCMYSGELLELITDIDDSDGTGSSPYSSGFSVGFGASAFN